MKVVFVNWTKPFFFKNPGQEYNITDEELLISKTSAINARKFLKFPIKLFTDDVGYSFYEKHGMLELFDEVDVDVLNQYNEHTLDAGKWWTSGKAIVIGKEEPPFLFLDNDFIVKSKLPESVFDYDLVHTHWELHRGPYFATEDLIEEYKVPIDNFNERMLMPNTSFVFMNNRELQDSYYRNHLKVVSAEYKDIPPWLWLLSDQSILGYCARELNCKVASIEDKTYLAYSEGHKDRFDITKYIIGYGSSTPEKDCGHTPMWIDTNNNNSIGAFEYWHVWVDKHAIDGCHNFRAHVVKELKKILRQ